MVDKSVKRPAVKVLLTRGAIFITKKAQSPLGNPGSPAPFALCIYF